MKHIPDASTKPYYRCFSCPSFRKECGGISTRGMTTKEWCECIRDVKVFAHLSNAYIAENANVSIKTVERIVAIINDLDIRRETARQIEIVVFGTANQFLCRLDHVDTVLLEKVQELERKLEYWRSENERKAKVIDKLLG